MTSTDRPSGRTARDLYRGLDGQPDERFKESLAGLSRRLDERTRQVPPDPQAAAEARRAALEAYDLARVRRLKTALAAAGATLLCAGVAWVIVAVAGSEPAPSAVVRPTVVPPSVAAAPTPAVEPVVEKAQAEPAAVPVEQAAAAPVATPEPLRRDEVREVQALLRYFGFDPGPVDGSAGSRTQAAVLRYQRARGLAETGAIDSVLLEELRRDPVPQVAQRPAPPRAMPPPPRRAPDPFTAALWRVERWFQTGR